ncbi:hypothetical protein RND81_02G129200 [Saponaria officinalis]|uniref:MHD domain-containing protein n=1 Tax=Saponaria officinalis TaxID=3572 RepID=A0AAW1MWJ9_SAPOF
MIRQYHSLPSDGSFDLMTYRLSTQPLIWVEAQIERHSRSRIEIMVKSRSQFKEQSTATNVEIELPVPSNATNPNIRTSMGSASYAPEKDALVWKIKSFLGGKEYMLRAEFSLPSIQSDEAPPERKAPIRVKFEILYFTVSGIQVICSFAECGQYSYYSLSPKLIVLIYIKFRFNTLQQYTILPLNYEGNNELLGIQLFIR